MGLWKKIKKAVSKPVDKVVDTAKDVSNDTADVAKTATDAVEDSTKYVASQVENGTALGAQYVVTGLVDAGEFLTQHECDIAIGAALTAAFATMEADPSEEAAYDSLAALCLAEFIDNVAVGIISNTLGSIIGDVVWEVPRVKSTVKNKDLLKSVIAFGIAKAVKSDPKLVVSTESKYISGVVIYLITALVCEGKLPVGFTAWDGAQSYL